MGPQKLSRAQLSVSKKWAVGPQSPTVWGPTVRGPICREPTIMNVRAYCTNLNVCIMTFLRYLEDLTQNFYTSAEGINFADSPHASKVKFSFVLFNSKGDQQLG